jgi:two-component system, OmpR family, alkaline phosphatase synthesis response regulator PhoP
MSVQVQKEGMIMADFKVLMIDDETNYPTAFKFLLESKGGYSVTLATSGQMGLDTAKTLKPDLIFLDVMMPGFDGIETLKRLKADKELKNIPVVMLTAVITEKAKLETHNLKVDGYLNKPLEMDILMAKIEEIKSRSAKVG